jgi:hypothetical protein
MGGSPVPGSARADGCVRDARVPGAAGPARALPVGADGRVRDARVPARRGLPAARCRSGHDYLAYERRLNSILTLACDGAKRPEVAAISDTGCGRWDPAGALSPRRAWHEGRLVPARRY